MAAIWKGAHPVNFRPGRPGEERPEAIVIHVMDGTLDGTDSWFNDPHARVSAHYGVGKGGEVHQYVKEVDTAFHAGTVVAPTWPLLRPNSNPNFYTIGIEHEGTGLMAQPWPQPQLEASLALAADIAGRWNIPIDANHIIGHHMIRASKPNCPGHGVDLAAYIQRLAALAGQAPPAAGQANGERPANFAVRLVHNANLRPRPRTDAAPVRMLLKGDAFQAEASVSGERVSGVDLWYRNGDGDFVWAGATDRPSG
jgi:N-acetyl-anhydromuramyl-L-alanine amidase AmpD